MSKKHFIDLADHIRQAVIEDENNNDTMVYRYSEDTIASLADWLASQNPRFNRDRWLAYIAGTCGPNGGKVKA